MKTKSSELPDPYSDFRKINLAIENNNQREINAIYKKYIVYFSAYIKKYYASLEKEEIISIYNDTLQFVFAQSAKGELRFYGAQFQTYLIRVGINRTLSYIKKYKKDESVTEELSTFEYVVSDTTNESIVHSSDFELILDIVKNMKAPCDIILSLTYEGVELEGIAEIIDRTKDATKTKRSSCMKTLRMILENQKIKRTDVYGE